MIKEMEEYKYKTSIHFNKPIEPQIAKLIKEIKARKKFLLKRKGTK